MLPPGEQTHPREQATALPNNAVEGNECDACCWQVLSYQSDVLSHKQQSKRLQEDNQRLQNQMLATGERLEKLSHDSSMDLKKEMLKLQRQLASEMLQRSV